MGVDHTHFDLRLARRDQDRMVPSRPQLQDTTSYIHASRPGEGWSADIVSKSKRDIPRELYGQGGIGLVGYN